MNYYVERGYVPMGVGTKSMHRAGAAQTLEYAYSDWCLGQFAKALGKIEDESLFLKRSGNWKSLFDDSSGWIRPKNKDRSWLTPFEPMCKGGAAAEQRYEITSPLFDRVTVRFDSRFYAGRSFTIVTKNNAPENVYIQSAKLNGKPLTDRFWITHAELVQGGTLELTLGRTPNKSWGRAD